MDQLILNLKKYLQESLGLKINPRRWRKSDSLPFFLRDPYDFYEVEILGRQNLLMVSRNESEQTPAILKKHIQEVQKKWDCEVIYVCRQVHSYDRRRLIDYKISFVIPQNQMYLPLLGLDLRQHFKRVRDERTLLSPSTQAIVIYALVNGTGRPQTVKELAHFYGYSPMTIVRALDEIELNELGSTFSQGRHRVLRFDLSKKELWDKAQNLMRSPVGKRVWVDYGAKALLRIQAGLTALAFYSMLAAPPRPVFAVSLAYWNECKRHGDINELPAPEPNAYDVEIWHYDPVLSAMQGVVDQFSLYLSLRGDEDERVAASLEEMMKKLQW